MVGTEVMAGVRIQREEDDVKYNASSSKRMTQYFEKIKIKDLETDKETIKVNESFLNICIALYKTYKHTSFCRIKGSGQNSEGNCRQSQSYTTASDEYYHGGN